jgi:outer membrane protein insertion porin family
MYGFKKPLLGLGVLLASTLSLSVFAEELIQGDEVKSQEPTPIEEFAPGQQTDSAPGATESIYDKGITITQIEVTGNKLISTQKIMDALSTKPGSLYSKKRLQTDLKALYDLGYFTEHLRVVPVATKEGIHLRIEVEENGIVNQFKVAGNSVVKESDILALFQDQLGQPQNLVQINQCIQQVEQLYKDKGYILARVDDIQEDPPGTVSLKMSEGKIHQIIVSGNKKTKEYVVKHAMAQKPGEIYNENTVNDDLKRVFSLQGFSDVRRVIKASVEDPNAYDLVVEVDEKKTGAISLGGGVDTGTGVFGSVGFSDPNFRGRGQNLSSMFSVGTGARLLGNNSTILNRRVVQFQTSWFNPSVNNTDNSLGANVFVRDFASLNIPLSLERRIGGDVTWSKPLYFRDGAAMSLTLGGENIRMQEGVDQARLNQYGLTTAQRSKQLEDGSYVYLTPVVSFDTRDNRFNPGSGWLNSFTARGAFGLENDSYATLQANLRRYVRLNDNMVFATNLQGAHTVFGDIPEFNMFRMGGSYTVRGFQEGGMGIGEGYLLGSAELRSKLPFLGKFRNRSLSDMISVAGFVDAATLFNESSANANFKRPGEGLSVGLGLRANVPGMGPLRLDFAKLLIGKSGDQTQSFNFGMGQKF